ncbi:MAG: alkaline phosphatase family protein [Deltaproteobacteria bacterium]|nr:alkaline phosphatase family protein [Deltaproteobacteria bacterium]
MLLILGLDGATLDLIAPWAADGTLPNLARLLREGASGRLAATVPAATFPSWTSFMTGVNPGRHGVFDFTRRDGGDYAVRFVNATYRKARTIWRLMSDAGRRVAVLGVPGTYPPEPVNGCMLSGFDTPVTTETDASFAYPAGLADDVAAAGGFPFADFQEFSIGAGWHAEACRRLCAGIERKLRLAERLLDRERWDCFMLMFGESDTAAHHFWGLHDAGSPRHDAAQAAAIGNPLRTVYAALDAAIGRLRARLPDATVVIASDHGFGGAGTTALHLNRFLAQSDFLRFAPRAATARLAGALRSAAVRAVPERWQARAFRLAGGRLADRVESGVRFGGIDWAGTRAFSEELGYFPSIWMNVQGRDRCGTVAVADYQATRAELIAALEAWRDPIHGTRVVRRVWPREALYHGPCVAAAPDLVLELETPGGYSYVGLPSYGRDGAAVGVLDPAALGGKLAGMSGSHRPDGVVILAGEGIAAGALSGAHIMDLAPTILALAGVAVPQGWDGRVLPVLGETATGTQPDTTWSAEERDYDDGETAELQRRLEQLGYLA